MSTANPPNTTSSSVDKVCTSQTGHIGEMPSSATVNRVTSSELLRGQKTVEIDHNGSTYRLQATRLGKLILTK